MWKNMVDVQYNQDTYIWNTLKWWATWKTCYIMMDDKSMLNELTCVVDVFRLVPSLWLDYIMLNINEIHWNDKCSNGYMLMFMKRW